ncbi:hypothetical protein [Synechococcus sp. MIT S1220]|uniref:hypothetical protein n=1 Tax=Synechococcus sp. MIT S1220 TaxID=3082549 RepID=UPI0039B0D07E
MAVSYICTRRPLGGCGCEETKHPPSRFHLDLMALNPIIGTDTADSLQGTSAEDSIQALAGNDTVTGVGSGDVVQLSEGNDSLVIRTAFEGGVCFRRLWQ